MTKEIVITGGVAKLTDPVIVAGKDKDKEAVKKPKDMTTKEQIEYLYASLGINIDEPLS